MFWVELKVGGLGGKKMVQNDINCTIHETGQSTKPKVVGLHEMKVDGLNRLNVKGPNFWTPKHESGRSQK